MRYSHAGKANEHNKEKGKTKTRDKKSQFARTIGFQKPGYKNLSHNIPDLIINEAYITCIFFTTIK